MPPVAIPRTNAASAAPLEIPDGDRHWVVLHTRPRREKKVAEVCGHQRAPCYLPLRRKSHRYGGRERVFWTPLFSGYVFCVADPPGISFLRQNQHVANVLKVIDQSALVEQLRQIRIALDTQAYVEIMPYLETGSKVRVVSGPLKGVEGIIQRMKTSTRIILNVDIIRQSTAVEVDSAWLEPV